VERRVEMAINDHGFKEPKYLVQPHDNDEYYFKIAKEFKKSQLNPNFTTLSFQNWTKKYKKRYGISGNSALEPIEKGDKR
jgi:spore coat protein CotF